MKRTITIISAAALTIVLLAGLAVGAVNRYLDTPLPLDEAGFVYEIRSGMAFAAVVRELAEQGDGRRVRRALQRRYFRFWLFATRCCRRPSTWTRPIPIAISTMCRTLRAMRSCARSCRTRLDSAAPTAAWYSEHLIESRRRRHFSNTARLRRFRCSRRNARPYNRVDFPHRR